MKLTIYTDEYLTDISKVVEADKLKIPYMVSKIIIKSLDYMDIDNQDDMLNFLTNNIDYLDNVVRATFGLSESELVCIDTSELLSVGAEIYKWGIEKINSLKGGDRKNLQRTV